MKTLLKAARLVAFVCLMFLASVGIGLSGGAIIPIIKIRRDAQTKEVELKEERNAFSITDRDIKKHLDLNVYQKHKND